VVLQVAAALFAAYMLSRHVPLALRALRRPRGEGARVGRAIVPVVNILLALVILAVAVKGLAGALISRP
jgi:Zn-dependent protease